jgi:tetratricopeptide (TPR) repeat protein
LAAAGQGDAAVAVLGPLAQSDRVEILASAARLLGSLKAFAPCVSALDKALALKRNAELLVQRGLCNHGLKQDVATLADFRAAVEADGAYAPAHYYYGMELKARSKVREARAELERAVALSGDSGIGKAARRALDSLR